MATSSPQNLRRAAAPPRCALFAHRRMLHTRHSTRHARPVQVTFACLVMAGESRHRASTVVVCVVVDGRRHARSVGTCYVEHPIAYITSCVMCSKARHVERARLQQRRERWQERPVIGLATGAAAGAVAVARAVVHTAMHAPMGLYKLNGVTCAPTLLLLSVSACCQRAVCCLGCLCARIIVLAV
jgi:hypothetical protein